MNLEPKALWKNFYDLTQIPRPSKKEEKIRAFLKKFGEELGLETIQDEVGNIIIRKPATPGMEDRKGVVLQGHMDMVPQANSDKDHNFETDPIEAYIDGDWVTANGTTLGADNGMGVAAAMAILEAKDIEHGPIEALITTDEETGMTGAFGLEAGVLQGDILMNLDSEDEGELYVGCAGGVDANISFDAAFEATPAGMKAYKMSVSGLKGGHSGMDIPLGRGNANKILFRFVFDAIEKFGLKMADVNGGSLRNAIPREAFATVLVPETKAEEMKAALKEFEAIAKKEIVSVDPDLTITLEENATPEKVFTCEFLTKLTQAVYGCPNGVIRMSNDMEGLVETSTNLAVVKSEGEKVIVQCLLRSSVDSAKVDLQNQIGSVFGLAGANVVFEGDYPGWKPNMDSAILKEMQEVYNNLYGKIPEIKAIHAGLECGLLGGVYPNWDMISFGPTIRYPHSPDEKVNIATVQKFWDYLLETLKHIPKK